MREKKYVSGFLFRLKNIKIRVRRHFCYLHITKISGNLILLHGKRLATAFNKPIYSFLSIMKIVNFSEQNSIVNQYLAEIRDVDYQKNRLLFRNNIQRIGELEAYEISKTLDYEARDITTPLGIARMQVPTDKIVLATIFRAGLPFDEQHTKVGIHVEYLATPSIEGKNLIIADPMLATGGSMELGYKAFLTKGTPKRIHVACVIASPEGIEHIRKTFPEDKTTIWCAAIDPGLNEHKYIVPGFGDAGDLCYGEKL